MLHRPHTVRTVAVQDLFLCPESLARCAIHPGICPFLYLFFIPQFKEHFSYNLLMPTIRCPYKCIVGYIQSLPEILEIFHHQVCVFLRGLSSVLCSLLHLLAVFIRACEEKNIVSLKLFIPRKAIRSNSSVGMANVWHIVDIVDGRCYVKVFF